MLLFFRKYDLFENREKIKCKTKIIDFPSIKIFVNMGKQVVCLICVVVHVLLVESSQNHNHLCAASVLHAKISVRSNDNYIICLK